MRRVQHAHAHPVRGDLGAVTSTRAPRAARDVLGGDAPEVLAGRDGVRLGRGGYLRAGRVGPRVRARARRRLPGAAVGARSPVSARRRPSRGASPRALPRRARAAPVALVGRSVRRPGRAGPCAVQRLGVGRESTASRISPVPPRRGRRSASPRRAARPGARVGDLAPAGAGPGAGSGGRRRQASGQAQGRRAPGSAVSWAGSDGEDGSGPLPRRGSADGSAVWARAGSVPSRVPTARSPTSAAAASDVASARGGVRRGRSGVADTRTSWSAGCGQRGRSVRGGGHRRRRDRAGGADPMTRVVLVRHARPAGAFDAARSRPRRHGPSSRRHALADELGAAARSWS